MLKTVEGIFRDGKVELGEVLADMDGTRVLVTFLPPVGPVQLSEIGVSKEEAAELRWRFGGVSEDWNSPEMDAYDSR